MLTRLSTASLALGTLLLGGCGGVQFEGKVFEAVGLTNEPKKQENQLADRAPLILPPEKKQSELPEPGVRAAAAPPPEWPADPEETRKRELAEAKARLEEAYRRNPEKRPGLFGPGGLTVSDDMRDARNEADSSTQPLDFPYDPNY